MLVAFRFDFEYKNRARCADSYFIELIRMLALQTPGHVISKLPSILTNQYSRLTFHLDICQL